MKYITFLVAITFVIASCKKDEIKTPAMTSLTMFNGVAGGASIKLGSQATTIASNGSAQLALMAGANDLYVWPIGDSVHPYFSNQKFVTQDKDVYSLFVCGQPGSVEGVIIKENIPYRTDSTAGIRFINLSPNSTPLNITLSKSPAVNEVVNLAYKQYTDFKSYPALYNSLYTFQIRDASTMAPAAPRATFTLSGSSVPRFANITLVIRGMVSSTPALGVTRMNNDR